MIAQATVGAKAPARIKTLLAKELVESWKGVQAFVVVCPIGLDAIVSNQLRADLTAKNIKMIVVKNSVARVALNQLDMAPAAELLDAPSAICYGGESVVDVARELVVWSKKADTFRLRGAFLEGQVFSAEQVYKLAAMPNRNELLAKIAGLVASPAGRLSASITALGGRIAGSIKALTEKLASQATTAEETPKPESSTSDEPTQPQKAEEVSKDTPAKEKEEKQDVQAEETPKPESSTSDEPAQSQKDEEVSEDVPDAK